MKQKLNSEKISLLRETLLFLHVEELKTICAQLAIPDSGKKLFLIARIINFLETGNIITEPKIPKISCAERGQHYPLAPNTCMLKGAYKNDLATRDFFKQLIGNHFHFTAFGIDWLNERWLAGNPPTYQEFAKMWQEEYTHRKQHGSTPKEEWRYIRFAQEYLHHHPHASHNEVIEYWKKEHKKNALLAQEIINFILIKS